MTIITDSLALYNYLSNIHEQIETFEVTQEFIDYRDEMKLKFKAHGREDWKRTMHADCLAVEYQLLKKKLVERPENISHDFVVGNTLVDCKVIYSQYFNVPDDKTVYYMENLKNNRVTHFAFYKFNPPQKNSVLHAGDIIKFKLCEVQRVDRVMKLLQPSNYGTGYYYTVKNT